MNIYNIYTTYKIGGKEIQDKVTVSTKYKVKNITVNEYKTKDGNNQDIKTKINIETDQSEKGISSMRLRESFQGLSPYDKGRVLEKGIVKKEDVEYDNMDIFI
jgi:hypothetical protein